MHRSNRGRIAFLAICLILFISHGSAQETQNEFQLRNKVEASIKLFKKLRFNITPELRINEKFSVDRFLIEGELAYKPWKFLEFGASYWFIVNTRESKSTEYLNRYAFQVILSNWFKRFKPALRLRYTNYAENDEDGQFLRYKASLKYNIPKCKLTPLVLVEAYHQLNDNYLYKMRYGIGAWYTIFKNNSIKLEYKFDYYMKDYINKHIVTISYKIKL